MSMLNLTVQFGGKTQKKYTLGDERKILVGRSQDCDVVIDNLGVSRTHCELFWAGHCWVLQDLQSNNGTIVNGKKVVTHNINDGDEIAIGKFKLVCELPQEGELEFAIEPPVKIPGYGESTIAMESKRQGAKPESKVKGYLTMERPAKRTFVLDKPIFVIGRHESADVRAEGWFTKKKHALIVRDELGFILFDATGKGRTYLNESEVDCERLKDGDLIRVGDRILKFALGSPG